MPQQLSISSSRCLWMETHAKCISSQRSCTKWPSRVAETPLLCGPGCSSSPRPPHILRDGIIVLPCERFFLALRGASWIYAMHAEGSYLGLALPVCGREGSFFTGTMSGCLLQGHSPASPLPSIRFSNSRFQFPRYGRRSGPELGGADALCSCNGPTPALGVSMPIKSPIAKNADLSFWARAAFGSKKPPIFWTVGSSTFSDAGMEVLG